MRHFLVLLLVFLYFSISSQAIGQWTQRADIDTIGREKAVAVGIGDKVFCGTGSTNDGAVLYVYSDWWEYDPVTNVWTQKADYPGNGGAGDYELAALYLGDYGYGDFAHVGMGKHSNDEHYKYDPSTNIWTQLSNAPSLWMNDATPLAINGKGYYQENNSMNFYEYNPIIDSWTIKSSMPFANFGVCASFVINDKGYVSNGSSFYEYNPASDSWSIKANYPSTSPFRPKGCSLNNHGFLIGGYDSYSQYSNDVWKYDPTLDSWSQLTDFPGVARLDGVIAMANNKVYYGLGQKENDNYADDWWEFDQLGKLNDISSSQFKVYPSLATDHINFESSDHLRFEIIVGTLKGQKVLTSNTNTGRLRIEKGNLEKGYYMYTILIDGRTVHSGKFLFQ